MLKYEYIKPYIPYNLKVSLLGNSEGELLECDQFDCDVSLKNNIVHTSIKNIKPILHPMSDIVDVNEMSDNAKKMFLKLHYDIFGLIDKGLAENANDMKQIIVDWKFEDDGF